MRELHVSTRSISVLGHFTFVRFTLRLHNRQVLCPSSGASHESPRSHRSSLSLQEPGGGRRESRHVFSIGSKGMSSWVGNQVRSS
jgi:hypothetical protein